MAELAADLYDRFRAQGSDIQGHLPFLVDLVESNGYTTVIELGVRSGVSSAAWLYGLSKTGGHLWSVDIDPRPYDCDGWTFIQGDDLDPSVYTQLPDEADIVFVDTSHTFDQTCAEIDLYLSRAKHWMLFHDTDAGPDFGVRPALDHKLPGWENRPGSNGLGMWRL